MLNDSMHYTKLLDSVKNTTYNNVTVSAKHDGYDGIIYWITIVNFIKDIHCDNSFEYISRIYFR